MNVVAARGAEEAAESRGYTLLLVDSRQDAELERRLIESLLSRRVEGLLVSPVRSIDAVQEMVARTHTPMIVYGQLQARPGIPTAIVEEKEASMAAIRAMLACGHRRYLLTGQDQPVCRNRIRQLTEFFAEASPEEPIELTPRLVADSVEGVAAVHSGLRRRDGPTAVISLTLTALPYTCRAIRELGLRVPEDVSVISFGYADWVEGYTPPISVITSNYQEHLEQATHYLVDLIQGRDIERSQPIGHSQFVVRESIAPRKPSMA